MSSGLPALRFSHSCGLLSGAEFLLFVIPVPRLVQLTVVSSEEKAKRVAAARAARMAKNKEETQRGGSQLQQTGIRGIKFPIVVPVIVRADVQGSVDALKVGPVVHDPWTRLRFDASNE